MSKDGQAETSPPVEDPSRAAAPTEWNSNQRADVDLPDAAAVLGEARARREDEAPCIEVEWPDPPAALARRIGLSADCAGLWEAVAFDIAERGRRIAVVASRHRPHVAAKAIGALLSGGAIEAFGETAGPRDWEEALAPGPEPVSAEGPTRPGCRVLVAEHGFREALARIGPARMPMAENPRLATLLGRLEAENAYLILALRFDADRQQVAQDLPEAYVLPWLDLWRAHLDERTKDIIGGEVDAVLGSRLRAVCAGAGHSERAAERELFLGLEDVLAGGPPPGGSLLQAFRQALESSANGEAGRKARAGERLRAVFRDGDRIARTLFAVRVHLPDAPWAAVRQIVETLLPEDEPVPSAESLPPDLLARWQGELAGAEMRGEARPALPSWRVVFRHDGDRHVERAGLQNAGGRIEPHAVFRLSDPALLVADHYPGFLLDLHEGFERARLYAVAGMPLSALVALHLSLCERLGHLDRIFGGKREGQAAADGFARVLAAMPTGARDLVEAGAPDGEAERERRITRLAAALGALAREEERRGRDPERLLGALLPAFARILPPASLTQLLAAFVLEGPVGSGHAIGLADLMSRVQPPAELAAVAGPAGARCLGEEIRRQVLARLVFVTDLRAAAGLGVEAGASARPWLDGLRRHAAEGFADRIGIPAAAIATYAEDFATQASLDLPYDWTPRQAPALAHDLFDGPPDGSPGLIVRLLARDPRAWLRDLDAYERHARPAKPTASFLDRVFSLESAVYWRLRDVVAVLLGGLDEKAVRRLVLPDGQASLEFVRFGESVWPALSRSLGLAGVAGLHEARDLVLDSYRRDRPAGSADYLPLLSLYPAALFAEWRLRRFTDAPIGRASPGHAAHLALLSAIRDGVEAAGRRPAVAGAFAALAAAQTGLAHRMASARLDETVARFHRKAAVLSKLADFMAPTRPDRAPAPAASTFDLASLFDPGQPP